MINFSKGMTFSLVDEDIFRTRVRAGFRVLCVLWLIFLSFFNVANASTVQTALNQISTYHADESQYDNNSRHDALVAVVKEISNLSSSELTVLNKEAIKRDDVRDHLIVVLRDLSDYEYYTSAIQLIESLRLNVPGANSEQVDWAIELMVIEAGVFLEFGAPRISQELINSIEYELSEKSFTRHKSPAMSVLAKSLLDMSYPLAAQKILELEISNCCKSPESRRENYSRLYGMLAVSRSQLSDNAGAIRAIDDYLSIQTEGIETSQHHIGILAQRFAYRLFGELDAAVFDEYQLLLEEIRSSNKSFSNKTYDNLAAVYMLMVSIGAIDESKEFVSAILDVSGNSLAVTRFLIPLIRTSCDQFDSVSANQYLDHLDSYIKSDNQHVSIRKNHQKIRERENCNAKLNLRLPVPKTVLSSSIAKYESTQYHSSLRGEEILKPTLLSISLAEEADRLISTDIKIASAKYMQALEIIKAAVGHNSMQTYFSNIKLADFYLSNIALDLASTSLNNAALILGTYKSSGYENLESFQLQLAAREINYNFIRGDVESARNKFAASIYLLNSWRTLNTLHISEYVTKSLNILDGDSQDLTELYDILTEIESKLVSESGSQILHAIILNGLLQIRLTESIKLTDRIDQDRILEHAVKLEKIIASTTVDNVTQFSSVVNILRAHLRFGDYRHAEEIIGLVSEPILKSSTDIQKIEFLFPLVVHGPVTERERYIDILKELYDKYFSKESAIHTDFLIKNGNLAADKENYRIAYNYYRQALDREFLEYDEVSENYGLDGTVQTLGAKALQALAEQMPLSVKDADNLVKESFMVLQLMESNELEMNILNHKVEQQYEAGADRLGLDYYTEVYRRNQLLNLRRIENGQDVQTTPGTEVIFGEIVSSFEETRGVFDEIEKELNNGILTATSIYSLEEVQNTLLDDEIFMVFKHENASFDGVEREVVYRWMISADGANFDQIILPGTTVSESLIKILTCGLNPHAWAKKSSICESKFASKSEFSPEFLPFDLESAELLYQQLIQPVKETIRGKRLNVLLTDLLQKIPLEVLVTDRGETDEQFLDTSNSSHQSITWFDDDATINYVPTVYQVIAENVPKVGSNAEHTQVAILSSGLMRERDGGCVVRRSEDTVQTITSFEKNLIANCSSDDSLRSYTDTIFRGDNFRKELEQLNNNGTFLKSDVIYMSGLSGVTYNTFATMDIGASAVIIDAASEREPKQGSLLRSVSNSFLQKGVDKILIYLWDSGGDHAALFRSKVLGCKAEGLTGCNVRALRNKLKNDLMMPPSVWGSLIALSNSW